MNLHLMFHVSLFEFYASKSTPDPIVLPLVGLDNCLEYKVKPFWIKNCAEQIMVFG